MELSDRQGLSISLNLIFTRCFNWNEHSSVARALCCSLRVAQVRRKREQHWQGAQSRSRDRNVGLVTRTHGISGIKLRYRVNREYRRRVWWPLGWPSGPHVFSTSSETLTSAATSLPDLQWSPMNEDSRAGARTEDRKHTSGRCLFSFSDGR